MPDTAPPTFEEQTRAFVVQTAEPPKEDTTNADKTKAAATAQESTAAEVADESTEAATTDTTGETATVGAVGTGTGDSDGDGDKENRGATDKPKNKISGAERLRQINEATRIMREAERSVAAREAAVAEREATLSKGGLTGKTPDTTVVESDAPPKPEDFEYGELDGRYIEAKISHGVKSALAANEAKAETKRQADAAAAKQQEMQQKYQAFEEAGISKYPDFNEVVVESAKAGDWKPTPVLGELILTSPEGPDVAYHLASNLKEAREIAGKSPLEQAAWFGRIAAKYSSKSSDAPAKTQPKATQAPPPVQRARGAGATTGFDPATTDFSAFEAGANRLK